MREIAPDAVRNASLTRRLRGYDRDETDHLLARIAESYAKVYAERARLSEEVVTLSSERQARDAQARAEVESLGEHLRERDRRIAELETLVARFEEERSKELGGEDRLREELSRVRRMQEEVETHAREHSEHVAARFALRERALVAQIAMLVSQLNDADATEATSRESWSLPERADRAAAALLQLDRVVETLEQESRREAELTVREARERADQIVRSAEQTVQPPEVQEAEDVEEAEEYDPFVVLMDVEREDTDIGEASWTSRPTFHETPESSR
jgi:cell division septum initiation protein DivIVA